MTKPSYAQKTPRRNAFEDIVGKRENADFSQNVYGCFKELSHHMSHNEFVNCKMLSSWTIPKLCHHLTLYQTMFCLDLSKLNALADGKNKSNIEICFGNGRKHCRKRRKCWLPAFSPFPTMFSKDYLLRVVKSQDCVVKS